MTNFLADPESLIATLADLFRKAGQEAETDVLANAAAKVEVSGGDMDSTYYSLLLSIDTDLCARHGDGIAGIEEAIIGGRVSARQMSSVAA